MAMTLLPSRLYELSWKTMKVQSLTTCNSKLRRKGIVSTCCSTSPGTPQRYAVLGAGFAGISVAWHLLQHCSKTSPTCIEIYDEVGIGGGASGVSGGLLHPYSPKGKLLWNGAECWEEALKLITVAEASVISELPIGEIDSENKQHTVAEPFVWRRGILRIAATAKNVYDMKKGAQDSLSNCKISYINSFAAKELLPELVLHSDFALYMPQAVNIHPEHYLKALFMACQRKARDLSASRSSGTQVSLHKRNVGSLLEFSGGYDAVIICLGAKVGLLPELVGKLPLSTCKGIVAHLELPTANREIYNNESPSILSSAWLAAQGPRKILIGATKEWGSFNTSCDVSIEEASLALKELLPKISTVYPAVKKWTVLGTRAGLRAMPPRTSLGALPLIGCIDNFVLESMQKDKLFGKKNTHSSQKVIPRYWFVGGLGSRGLIYHGLLGKLIAKAVASGNQDVLPSELTSWMLSS